jgi:hypothetical protein
VLIPARRRPASARRVRALLIGATLVSVLVLPAAALPAGPGSAATAAVAAAPRAAVPFTVAPTPTITGKPVVGAQLIAVPGAWKPVGARLTYQWSSGDQVIARATLSRYTVTAQDAGRAITVEVTATRTGNVSAVKTSAPTAPVMRAAFRTVAAPTITGTATVGAALTAKPGTWSPAASFGYVWSRDDVRIPGATAATYRLTQADAGTRITVSVTGTKTGYDAQARTSAAKAVPAAATPGPKPTPAPTTAPKPTPDPTPTTAPKPTPTAVPTPTPTPTAAPAPAPTFLTSSAPTIVGALHVGATVRAVTGTWTPTPTAFTYRWYVNDVWDPSRTAASYTIGRDALGKRLTLTVTASAPGLRALARSTAGPSLPVTWSPAGASDGKGSDVVAILGQSNAQGGGVGFDPVADGGRAGLDQLVGNGPLTGTVVPASDSLLHVDTWKDLAGGPLVGPGMEFGRRLLADAEPGRRVLLVPAAKGSTSLTKVTGEKYTWDPSPDAGSPEAGLINLYDNARTQIDRALADQDNRLVAVIWIQGETDSGVLRDASSAAERAAAEARYRSRLLELVTGIGDRYGNAPFLIGAMVPEWVAGERPDGIGAHPDAVHRQSIQAAHLWVAAERPEAVFVEGVRGHDQDVHLHYDATGARLMGDELYDELAAIRAGGRP